MGINSLIFARSPAKQVLLTTDAGEATQVVGCEPRVAFSLVRLCALGLGALPGTRRPLFGSLPGVRRKRFETDNVRTSS